MREHVFELFSFSIKRVARWGCDVFSLTSLTMKKVRVSFIYLLQKKQVLLKIKSPSLKTIRVLQRILWCFLFFFTFWNHQLLEPSSLPKKWIPVLQKHRILATMLMTQDVLIEEIISSFWENIYFELFSFSIKRAARRGCDILLTSLTMEKLRIFFFWFVLYSLSEKKKTGLAWTSIVLRRILTVY